MRVEHLKGWLAEAKNKEKEEAVAEQTVPGGTRGGGGEKG